MCSTEVGYGYGDGDSRPFFTYSDENSYNIFMAAKETKNLIDRIIILSQNTFIRRLSEAEMHIMSLWQP